MYRTDSEPVTIPTITIPTIELSLRLIVGMLTSPRTDLWILNRLFLSFLCLLAFFYIY